MLLLIIFSPLPTAVLYTSPTLFKLSKAAEIRRGVEANNQAQDPLLQDDPHAHVIDKIEAPVEGTFTSRC